MFSSSKIRFNPPPFPSRSKLKPEYEIPSDAPWFQYNNAIKAILLLIQLIYVYV